MPEAGNDTFDPYTRQLADAARTLAEIQLHPGVDKKEIQRSLQAFMDPLEKADFSDEYKDRIRAAVAQGYRAGLGPSADQSAASPGTDPQSKTFVERLASIASTVKEKLAAFGGWRTPQSAPPGIGDDPRQGGAYAMEALGIPKEANGDQGRAADAPLDRPLPHNKA